MASSLGDSEVTAVTDTDTVVKVAAQSDGMNDYLTQSSHDTRDLKARLDEALQRQQKEKEKSKLLESALERQYLEREKTRYRRRMEQESYFKSMVDDDEDECGKYKQQRSRYPPGSQYRHESDEEQENEGISSSELEARMRYLTALSEIQSKEEENLALRKRLAAEKGRVAKSANIKLTKFSGSADLEDYVKQFEAIAKFNDWQNDQKVVVLLSKLEGEALAAVSILMEPTYDQVIAQLREHFSCERHELASLKLQNKLQGESETFEQLSLDIQKLTNKAYPTADLQTKARISRDSFINAVTSSKIRENLRDKNLTTLRECVDEARRTQANLEVEINRAKTHSTSAANPSKAARHVTQTGHDEMDISGEIRRLQEEFENFKVSSKPSSKQSKQKSSGKPMRQVGSKKRPLVCWNCNMLGHIARYCPFPEDLISKWIQEGVISTPRNRREDFQPSRSKSSGSWPKSTFSGFSPRSSVQGNSQGEPARGPPTTPR